MCSQLRCHIRLPLHVPARQTCPVDRDVCASYVLSGCSLRLFLTLLLTCVCSKGALPWPAVISLTDWFLVAEAECVYCAVRTEHLTFSNSTFCPHNVFMCFVWIWEQTTIISLYSINWPVCITETECVYCAARTEHLTLSNSTFCPHSVFMCFVWIWEQTAIISLYSNNWLVCITETKSVYCAVWTEHLTFSNSTFCPHSLFMCFVWIWEQTAIISLYSINWLVCITET